MIYHLLRAQGNNLIKYYSYGNRKMSKIFILLIFLICLFFLQILYFLIRFVALKSYHGQYFLQRIKIQKMEILITKGVEYNASRKLKKKKI